MLLAAVGILASLIGTFFVRIKKRGSSISAKERHFCDWHFDDRRFFLANAVHVC